MRGLLGGASLAARRLEVDEEAGHEFDAINTLLLVVVLGLCILAAYLIKKYRFYYMPESAAALLVGLLVGGVARLITGNAEELHFLSFQPELFFFLLLPPIILDAAYNMPTKSNFFFNASSILAFAFLGTFISTIVIGTSVWGASILVQNSGATRELGFERVTWAFKFSSMLSATDPVATLSVLSSFGQLRDANLFNLIFGE